MAGLLSSVGAILRYASNVSEDGVAKGTLRTLEDKKMQLLRADGSMMKLLGKYIVEPIAVVSDDLKDVEELDNILGLHMDMFTGYYMQVFSILKDQYNLSVNVIVDTLATDNGGLERILLKGVREGIELSSEADDNFDYLGEFIKLGNLSTEANYKYEEPKPDDITKTIDAGRAEEANFRRTMEQDAIASGRKDNLKNLFEDRRKAVINDRLKKIPKDKRAFATNKDLNATPPEMAASHKDLLIPNAIQRTININATVVLEEPGTDGKFYTKTIVIPVTIKLAVIFTSKENIINAIGTKSDNYGFSERLDEYRAGAISLTDFVFASDLIGKYKNRKLKDKDDILKLLQSRELSGNSKIVTNGFTGFEKYYNMYIISPATKASIENEVRGKLAARGKDKFLDRANGLSVTVVDPDYERIQIMLKDVRGKTDLTFKSAIKKDKNGSDYGEIIKALVGNKPPAF